MFLSIQLPVTIFTQIYLTSSKKVMGSYANSRLDKILLWTFAVIVTGSIFSCSAASFFTIRNGGL